MPNKFRAVLSPGQVLVAVLVAFLVLSILVPVMVFFAQRESVWSTKQTKNTTAFAMAEAGQEKGYNFISTSTSAWGNILQGHGPGPGFIFDQSYNDVGLVNPGGVEQTAGAGSYTISITSGPGTGQVTVITVGRDSANKELRGLKTIYSTPLVAAIMGRNGIVLTGASGSTAQVHWGPIVSYTTIQNPQGGNDCYPRFYAVSSISVGFIDANCHPANWVAQPAPCTDGVQYWAYNCGNIIPTPPTIDVASYQAAAKASLCDPVLFANAGIAAGAGVHNLVASPVGSCYFPGDQRWNNIVSTSPLASTIYVEGTLSVGNPAGGGSFLQGSIIVGNSFNSWGPSTGMTWSYTIPDSQTPSGIPINAWQEYQQFDTALTGEYPGDAGYRQVVTAPPINGTFTFACPPPTCPVPASLEVGTTDQITLRGFIYTSNSIGALTGSIHGLVYSPNTPLWIWHSIYYDQDAANKVIVSPPNPTRIWWSDVVISSWPGP